jgi:hypothetical protein
MIQASSADFPIPFPDATAICTAFQRSSRAFSCSVLPMCSSTWRCHFSGLMSGKAKVTKASGSSEQSSNCWTRSSSVSSSLTC